MNICPGSVCVHPDKPMQLNQALFMLGGGSGYVPQPDLMRDDVFDPFDKDTLNVEPITIQLQVRSVQRDFNLDKSSPEIHLLKTVVSHLYQVLGARHLPKNGRSIVCPFVEVEMCGTDYDSCKCKTDVVGKRPIPASGCNEFML